MPFSAFSLFNALVPKDLGSKRIARGLSYGPSERHKLDIYAPRWRREKLPVLVFIYGGSWSDGDRSNYEFAGRAMAALGYVVVVADYRLVPEVEYPGFLIDCTDAYAWTVAHIAEHGGDSSRIGLMGHSAGAYNAAMLALDPAYLRKRGLLDGLKCLVGLSGPYDFLPFDGPISLRVFGGIQNPDRTQPANLVSDRLPAAFLGSGDRDDLVSPRNTKTLAARLAGAGGEVVERHYPSLGHPHTLLALAVPMRAFTPVRRDVAEFLKTHLQ